GPGDKGLGPGSGTFEISLKLRPGRVASGTRTAPEAVDNCALRISPGPECQIPRKARSERRGSVFNQRLMTNGSIAGRRSASEVTEWKILGGEGRNRTPTALLTPEFCRFLD